MLMKDPKKSVSVIMARLNGKTQQMDSEPVKDPAEQDDSIALETAAEELMKAMESKSPAQVVEAFKSLMSLCEEKEESSPESEE